MTAQALELGDIQGNVLQGYGYPHALYVSLAVGHAPDGRGLLAELRPHVTPASRWAGDGPPSTLNLAFSHHGLTNLHVGAAVLESFPPEFCDGMAGRAGRLGDVGPSRPDCWEPGLREGEIDVLVMLQAESVPVLRERMHRLRERVRAYPGVAIRGVHEGHLERSRRGWAREHFGFRDGFSQPAIRGGPDRGDPGQGVAVPFFDGGWRPLEPGEFILGYRDEDGVLPDAPVPPFARNGTFMVYRKLAQNVAGFRRLLRHAADLHYDGDVEMVAAKLAGRWRDGTPLMLHPYVDEGAGPREELNDFRYGADDQGRSCPIGAHVRRANPRDGLRGGAQRTRRHRIIRRGMPYGRFTRRNRRSRRGLIFVGFNASIARQFEVINGWLNDGDVFGLGREPDILAGSRAARMTVPGDPPVYFASPAPLVSTRGGEYLFLPGLTTLGTLADDTAIRP